MNRFPRILVKIVGYGLLAISTLIILGIAFIFLYFPRSEPASKETIERTPERRARGAYLVQNVAFCMQCHAERNWQLYSGPAIPATLGKGALVNDSDVPAYASNLTPYSLRDWTDGEVVRAITSGVNKDGRALHPLMPFPTYSRLTAEDARAIVAYLRTLPAIEYNVPPPKVDSLKKILIVRVVGRILPKPWRPRPAPYPANKVMYGEYLVTIADCRSCHRSDFSGGRWYAIPGNEKAGKVASSNLTPDVETGIGRLSRENFIGRFKAFASPESRRIAVPAGGKNTVMPWAQYAGMTEEDLGAIYDYLRTVQPVKRRADAARAR